MSKKRFTFMIDPVLSARLKAMKARAGMSEGELIRRAIQQWLESVDLPLVKAHERPFQDIRRFLQAISSAKQPRAAYRKEFFRTEARYIEAWPIAITVADGKIDILAREIDGSHRCRDP